MDYFFLNVKRGSVPWNILCRFDLCLKIINSDRNVPTHTKVSDCLNISVRKGKLKAANIEANEIVLLTIKTIAQITIVRPKIILNPGILIDRPNRTPRLVATPLPPLKFRKIVQLCPHMQLIPIIRDRASAEIKDVLLSKILPSNTTGSSPFAISRINTVTPQPLPKRRNALVAPTLPDPNLRISTFLIIFANK